MTKLGYQIPNFTYPGTSTAPSCSTSSRRRRRRPTRSGFDTVMVMDHFYQLPMLGAARRRDARVLHAARRRWPSTPTTVRLSARSSPATPTGTRRCWRRRSPTLDIVSRRPGPARHRRRLVRARARLARLRVRHVHRPVREARGGAADHPADARATSGPTLDGQVLPVDGRDQPAAAARADPDHDRRQRREEDAAPRRPVRGRVQPHLRPPTRSPASSTSSPAHCERLGRDRSEITVSLPGQRLHRADARRGGRRARRASRAPGAGRRRRWPTRTPRAIRVARHPRRPRRDRRATSPTASPSASTASPSSSPANGHIPGRVELLGETLSKVLA